MALPQNLGQGFAVIAIEFGETHTADNADDDSFIVPFQRDTATPPSDEVAEGLRLMAHILRGHGYQVTDPLPPVEFVPAPDAVPQPETVPDFALPAPAPVADDSAPPPPDFGKREVSVDTEGPFSFGAPARAERRVQDGSHRKWADFSRADDTDPDVGLKPLI